MKNSKLTKSSMVAAITSAIIGSLCCVGPFVFLSLGFGGAWIGSLSKFHAIFPYAVIFTAIFLGFAFWQLYISPRRCHQKIERCTITKSLQIQRTIFWIILVLAILMLAFPYYR